MSTALITGGTKGIGRGITKMLLKRGYYVFVTYSNDDSAAEKMRGELQKYSDKLFLLKVNNADQAQVQELITFIKKRGHINCLVLNAGHTLRKPLKDIMNEEWENSLGININSNVYIIRDLLPKIEPNSRIIFIGSMMGILPHATSLAYGVSKAAIHAMARNLVKEFEGTGTTVNAIAPGFIETEWQKNKPSHIRNNICEKTALHRFGTVEEVVRIVETCLDNQFINGSILEVNGGYCYK